MKVKTFNSKDELYQAVTELFVKNIQDNPNITLGLATGGTAIDLYKKLVADYQVNHTDYSRVKTFNLDEYVGLPKNHVQSYYQYMKENLFNHININMENVNIPNGNANNISEECNIYNSKLKNNQIDIQLLGIGSNGHIAFNEPFTSFESDTHVVELEAKTISDNARFFNSYDEVPKKAITMGIKNIMDAKVICLIAVGENKSDAIYNMINGEVNESCPASILQKHNNCLVFLDNAAASKLKK